MAKKNVNTKSKSKSTVKCQCSTCGQVANAQEGSGHFYCKGIHQDIIDRMPAKFKGITNPSKKGTWVKHVEPQKEAAA
jgi:hypothetical protein